MSNKLEAFGAEIRGGLETEELVAALIAEVRAIVNYEVVAKKSKIRLIQLRIEVERL